MRPGTILTILRRELGDILRDRRALVIALVLPVLLYPALFAVGGRLFDRPAEVTVPLQPRVSLGPGLDHLARSLRRAGCWVLPTPRRVEQAIADYELDAHLVLQAKTGRLEVLFDRHRVDREELLHDLRRGLDTWHQAHHRRNVPAASPLGRELARLAVHPGPGAPPALAPGKGGGGLAGMVPLVLILILVSGCAFAALDLLPGQKERGTLETLFIQPVRAGEVIAAKYLVVLFVGVMAVTLNLGGMWATTLLLGAGAFTPGTGGLLLLLSLPLALAVAAGLVWVCALAETFREGQNYLLPLTLGCLIPTGLGMSPAVPLGPITALLPLTGNVLVLRACLAGRLELLPLAVNLAGTLAWGGLALWGAVRLLRREDIRSGRAAALDPTAHPPGPRALFYAVIILFAYLVAAPILQHHHRVAGLVASLLLFTLGPALLLPRLVHLPRERAFPLRRPGIGALAGVLTVAAGGVLFSTGWLGVQGRFLPLPAELTRGMAGLLTALGGPGIALLLVGAILPAVCEETLFRGALLGAFRSTWSPGRALVYSSLLFALFHLSVHRFLATLVMGVLFGLVLLRTRNLLLAVLCHAVYNGLLFTLPGWSVHLPPALAAGLFAGTLDRALLLTLLGLGLALTGLLLIRPRPQVT